MTHDYLIEALAPLVFRSGKPFGAQAGADGAAFPLPSSLAGLLRTLHADQHQLDFSCELRQIVSAGPLLGRRALDGSIVPLLPKPADALYLRHEGLIQVIRLSPGKLPPDSGCDLRPELLPVGMRQKIDGKPVPGPQYWPLASLQSWSAGAPVAFATLRAQGLDALPAEERTHVALDDETLAAGEGRLFQTGGIDLAAHRHAQGWQEHDLVFLARSAARVDKTLATFGGERRLSRLHPQQSVNRGRLETGHISQYLGRPPRRSTQLYLKAKFFGNHGRHLNSLSFPRPRASRQDKQVFCKQSSDGIFLLFSQNDAALFLKSADMSPNINNPHIFPIQA